MRETERSGDNAAENVQSERLPRKAITREETAPKGALKFLYYTKLGAACLKILTARWVSKLAGRYLDSKFSRHKIKRYIKKHAIDMSQYEEEDYASFNAFFTRRIKKELRPFAIEESAFVSPCDGKLSLYEIGEDLHFNVKGFDYTVEELLQNGQLAREFLGGYCFIFRLCVEDYHRYFYLDNGEKGENVFIRGKLHTVQPTALGARRVFAENCREYTVLNTARFGKIVQCEVGAMMVGRIVNHHGVSSFSRGEEKGKFEFGGSTIVLFVQKGAVLPDAEFLQNTKEEKETVVKCGETIGVACAKPVAL